ncbi:MAG TPA: hypothetical protein VFF79_12705 [Conexibacter sp.]|jgi:hypothetical protein|nr:hypothetical protein [Conexibacter sp.]
MRIVTHDELLKRRPITPADRERIDEIKRAMESPARAADVKTASPGLPHERQQAGPSDETRAAWREPSEDPRRHERRPEDGEADRAGDWHCVGNGRFDHEHDGACRPAEKSKKRLHHVVDVPGRVVNDETPAPTNGDGRRYRVAITRDQDTPGAG